MAADPSSRRLRVMVFAHACDPEKGSEKAAGWGVVRTLSEIADVVVLLHPRNAPNVRRWQADHPGEPLTFVEVPEPAWGLRLRRSRLRGLPVWRARYLGWLRQAKQVARRLETDQHFDAVVHASLGIYWLPSPVVDLETPGIWGPVAGAASSSPALWRYLGVKGVLAELGEVATARILSLAPATRRTWQQASVRLVESDSARRRLPRGLRDSDSTELVNRVMLLSGPPTKSVPRKPYLIFPSPLEKRKGGRLALHALAHTPPDVRLKVINDGPEEQALQELAARLGIADRVEFLGRVPRDQMFTMMAEAAAGVFTGLREEGGAALAEAMLSGTPVIVLGWGGARLVAEAATDPSRVALVEPGSARDTERRLAEAMARFCASPSTGAVPYLDQETTRRALQDAVRKASGMRATPPTQVATWSTAGSTDRRTA